MTFSTNITYNPSNLKPIYPQGITMSAKREDIIKYNMFRVEEIHRMFQQQTKQVTFPQVSRDL